MYCEHSVFRTPPDEKVIWKYLSFAKFVNMIESESFSFTRLKIQQDSKEGLGSSYARHNKYISSWHMNDHENMAMWNQYGKDDGVALKTTIGDLRNSIGNDPIHTYIGEVEYVSEEKISKLNLSSNLYFPVIYKTLPYSFENEVRMCVSSADNENPLQYERVKLSSGISVSVELSTLIKEVFISPYCDEWFHSLVETYLRNKKILTAAVKRSAGYCDKD